MAAWDWILKAASACGVWALTIPFAVLLLAVVGAEETWKRAVRSRRERRLARQVDRERASW